MKGEPIIQFCGLRAKCYSIVTSTEHKQTAAGVKRSQQKLLRHHKYVEILNDFSEEYVKQKTFASKGHTLYTQEQTRVGLSALDIKRYILSNGIDTVPHGYYK